MPHILDILHSFAEFCIPGGIIVALVPDIHYFKTGLSHRTWTFFTLHVHVCRSLVNHLCSMSWSFLCTYYASDLHAETIPFCISPGWCFKQCNYWILVSCTCIPQLGFLHVPIVSDFLCLARSLLSHSDQWSMLSNCGRKPLLCKSFYFTQLY